MLWGCQYKQPEDRIVPPRCPTIAGRWTEGIVERRNVGGSGLRVGQEEGGLGMDVGGSDTH